MNPSDGRHPDAFQRCFLDGWVDETANRGVSETAVHPSNSHWIVVWIPLKNNSQLWWLFPMYGKIKDGPNHQPGHILMRTMTIHRGIKGLVRLLRVLPAFSEKPISSWLRRLWQSLAVWCSQTKPHLGILVRPLPSSKQGSEEHADPSLTNGWLTHRYPQRWDSQSLGTWEVVVRCLLEVVASCCLISGSIPGYKHNPNLLSHVISSLNFSW